MAIKLEITPEAEKDISAIVSDIYLLKNVASAMHAVSELKNQLNSLATPPERGRVGGCDGTREIVLSKLHNIVVYTKSNDLLTIVRVLHVDNDVCGLPRL